MIILVALLVNLGGGGGGKNLIKFSKIVETFDTGFVNDKILIRVVVIV